jgi:hypothetical protein
MGWEKDYMQQVWLALIGGIILGWLIEWVIDWQFWRRNLAELRQENQALRRQLSEAQAQLAALQTPGAPAGAASELGAKQPGQAAKPNTPAAPSSPSTKGK